MKFSELDLRPEILKAVTNMGYQDLTPIQEKTISHVLNGRDLLARAAGIYRMNGKRESRVNKITIVAWIISFVGMALWLYGYFAAGHPSLIDWHAYTPWWVADFLPNIEAEIGMALASVGTVLVYWPSKR